MPNNSDLIPTLVNLSPQQLITAIVNILPTTDAPAFVDPVGEFFRILKLEFLVKSSEKILQLATFSRQKDETLKMLYKKLLKLKEDTQSITNLEATDWYLRSLEGTPTARTSFATGLCRIWRLVHFVGCVQHFRKARTGSCTL